jgi:hypothetical protein
VTKLAQPMYAASVAVSFAANWVIRDSYGVVEQVVSSAVARFLIGVADVIAAENAAQHQAA